MAVDVEERELLAQLVLVSVVRVDVDRLSEKKRFVQSVELLLDCLRSTFEFGDVGTNDLADSANARSFTGAADAAMSQHASVR